MKEKGRVRGVLMNAINYSRAVPAPSPRHPVIPGCARAGHPVHLSQPSIVGQQERDGNISLVGIRGFRVFGVWNFECFQDLKLFGIQAASP